MSINLWLVMTIDMTRLKYFLQCHKKLANLAVCRTVEELKNIEPEKGFL